MLISLGDVPRLNAFPFFHSNSEGKIIPVATMIIRSELAPASTSTVHVGDHGAEEILGTEYETPKDEGRAIDEEVREFFSRSEFI